MLNETERTSYGNEAIDTLMLKYKVDPDSRKNRLGKI